MAEQAQGRDDIRTEWAGGKRRSGSGVTPLPDFLILLIKLDGCRRNQQQVMIENSQRLDSISTARAHRSMKRYVHTLIRMKGHYDIAIARTN
jgi:hypothetical protein